MLAKKILTGECTKKEVSEALGITVRQIDRLILKFKNVSNDIEKTNRYLNDVFTYEMNVKFAYEIDAERNMIR